MDKYYLVNLASQTLLVLQCSSFNRPDNTDTDNWEQLVAGFTSVKTLAEKLMFMVIYIYWIAVYYCGVVQGQ